MATLEKRIAVLESKSSPAEIVNFIHLIGPDDVDKEIQTIEDLASGSGQRWQRLPGETEQELKERAKSEATPNEFGVRSFLCS